MCKSPGPNLSLLLQRLGLPSPESDLGREAEKSLFKESIIVDLARVSGHSA